MLQATNPSGGVDYQIHVAGGLGISATTVAVFVVLVLYGGVLSDHCHSLYVKTSAKTTLK